MRYLIIFCVGLLFWSCDKGVEPENPNKKLEVIVITETGELVEGATVNIFATQSDFIYNRKQIAEPLITDQTGTVKFSGINPLYFAAFLSVEKRDANNWSTNIETRLLKAQNRVVITIKASLATQIAGRFSKRWRQVKQVINGTEFREPCSTFQRIYTFLQTKSIKSSIPADCSPTGAEFDLQSFVSFWRLNPRGTSIIIGTEGNQSGIKVITILELNDKKFRYHYKPANDLDSPITIEEEFVAVE